MEKAQFWELIQRTVTSDKNQQYDDILKELRQLNEKDLCHFLQLFRIYCESSESPATYLACRLLNGFASDDTELYFRLWLIAQGHEVFFGTLKSPDKLAGVVASNETGEFEIYEFEMIAEAVSLAVAETIQNPDQAMMQHAFTDQEIQVIVAEIETDMDWTETEETLWEQAPIRAPKLYAKYGQREAMKL